MKFLEGKCKNDKSTFNVIQSEMGNSRTCQLSKCVCVCVSFLDETLMETYAYRTNFD